MASRGILRAIPAGGGQVGEIVYLIGDTIWSVAVEAQAHDLRFGTPPRLVSGFRIPPGATLASRLLAVSRDGSRIFAAQAVDQPDTHMIHVQTGALD